jgi:hypothetical protein
MVRWAVLLTIAGSAWAGPPPTGPSAPQVAVWELKTIGLDAGPAEALTRALQAALERSSVARLLPEAEASRRLQAARLSHASGPGEVAAALKVSWLVTGTIAVLGEESSLDLKLLDGRSGAEVRRVSTTLPGDAKALAETLDETMVHLLQPENWVGSLSLSVTVDGAKVSLDGSPIAVTPLKEPIAGLSPGKHIVMISKEGYNDFSTFVVVKYNKPVVVQVDLANAMVTGVLYEEKKPPKPPPPKPVVVVEEEPKFWNLGRALSLSGLAAGVLLVGGGVILGVHARDVENSIEKGTWTADNQDTLQDKLSDGRRSALWANILMGAGGAIAAGCLVLFIVLDNPAPEPGAPASTALQPVVLPGGAGLSLTGRF